MQHEQIFDINSSYAPTLFGEHNNNIPYLEKLTNVTISDRGNVLTVNGQRSDLHKIQYILAALEKRLFEGKQSITHADIDAALRFWSHEHMMEDDFEKSSAPSQKERGDIVIKTRKKTIAPRSPNQEEYMRSIRKSEMVFGMGPAGTGKTYLAVAEGVSMFLAGNVERLIFTRPAVEAGENLGFLPGDMREKIDPYLRPIYDALHDMLPQDFMMKKMEDGSIEIAPLAFMRGRTLSNAFVVLDEAQNTTKTQMKMFLTRMGESSRMVITGDLTQTDLPRGQISGLRDAIEILGDVPEISMHYFDSSDVVRHKLVGKIVCAYDNHHKHKKSDL